MKAFINIEDGIDGQLNVQAVYAGGFNEDSPAHATVALLMKHMDTLGKRVEIPREEAREMLKGRLEQLGVRELPPDELLEYLPTVEVIEGTPSGALES